jgi:NADH:ubiquinone oxidoreductase subunit 2 (subunit N)
LLLLFSTIGIPPFLGFFIKFYTFSFLFEKNLYFILLLGIIASVLSAFYYIRIINNLFFQSNTKILTFSIQNFNNYFFLYFLTFFFVLGFSYLLNLLQNLQILKLLVYNLSQYFF